VFVAQNFHGPLGKGNFQSVNLVESKTSTRPERTSEYEVRRISPQETVSLRREVLRPDRPLEESVFPGDDNSTTEHWGAFVNTELVGVASIYPEPMPAEVARTASGSTWRLRGMAVAEQHRNEGIGKVLLDACIASIKNQGGTLLWCNARSTAIDFYLREGFALCSEDFEIPDIGPHRVMARELTSN
jgi:predicted GNAT family N-acyltransferase